MENVQEHIDKYNLFLFLWTQWWGQRTEDEMKNLSQRASLLKYVHEKDKITVPPAMEQEMLKMFMGFTVGIERVLALINTDADELGRLMNESCEEFKKKNREQDG